jgi:hypothetical protein
VRDYTLLSVAALLVLSVLLAQTVIVSLAAALSPRGAVQKILAPALLELVKLRTLR